MNHVIAYELITAELNAYRNLGYDETRQLVGERLSRLVRGHDGADYDVATIVQARRDGTIEITAFVGVGDWGAPHDPIFDSIVISPPCASGV